MPDNMSDTALRQPGVRDAISLAISKYLYDFGEDFPAMARLLAGAKYCAGLGFASGESVSSFDPKTPTGEEIKGTALDTMKRAGMTGNRKYGRLVGLYLGAYNAGANARQRAK